MWGTHQRLLKDKVYYRYALGKETVLPLLSQVCSRLSFTLSVPWCNWEQLVSLFPLRGSAHAVRQRVLGVCRV